MSKLYIAEFSSVPRAAQNERIHVPRMPPIAQQVVDFTAGATASAAFSQETRFVRLITDDAANVAFGAAPTAAGTDMYLAPGVAEYFAVEPGHKVSALQI